VLGAADVGAAPLGAAASLVGALVGSAVPRPPGNSEQPVNTAAATRPTSSSRRPLRMELLGMAPVSRLDVRAAASATRSEDELRPAQNARTREGRTEIDLGRKRLIVSGIPLEALQRTIG